MASPVISVQITADAKGATKGINDATQALGKLDSAAGSTAKKTRDVAGGIETVGGTAGKATTGLRDMSDAVAMAGFPGLAAGMQVAAVGLESLDGAATLFEASQEAVTKGGKKLLTMLGLQTTATTATATAEAGAATSTTAFGTAMNFLKTAILTNPIFWIAAILIGIVVAFVLLYKKCEGFRKIVNAVFKFVATYIKTVMNLVMKVVRVAIDFVTAYFKFVIKFWTAVWNAVVAYVKWAVGIVRTVVATIINAVQAVVDKVKSVFAKVYEWIVAPFRKAMDWVKSHVKLPHLSLPFGIGGKSTAVSVAGPRAAPTLSASSSGGGVTVIFNGPTDPHGTVRELRRLFREDQARLGRPARLRPVVA